MYALSFCRERECVCAFRLGVRAGICERISLFFVFFCCHSPSHSLLIVFTQYTGESIAWAGKGIFMIGTCLSAVQKWNLQTLTCLSTHTVVAVATAAYSLHVILSQSSLYFHAFSMLKTQRRPHSTKVVCDKTRTFCVYSTAIAVFDTESMTKIAELGQDLPSHSFWDPFLEGDLLYCRAQSWESAYIYAWNTRNYQLCLRIPVHDSVLYAQPYEDAFIFTQERRRYVVHSRTLAALSEFPDLIFRGLPVVRWGRIGIHISLLERLPIVCDLDAFCKPDSEGKRLHFIPRQGETFTRIDKAAFVEGKLVCTFARQVFLLEVC
jgi:hypothetical protein